MALGAAYVAHTSGADTAYYNPANMAFMQDKQFMEVGATLAHLPRNEFVGDVASTSGKSEIENLYIPNFHYVANAMGDWRWGVSLTAPGGLTKRWNSPVQKAFAEEFTLKILEFNPVVSYKISDNFALGGGLRFIYSEGVVKNDGTLIGRAGRREMEGDTKAFGYNLAMSYKPQEDVTMAVTYRSNVDLKEKGEANLFVSNLGIQHTADVTVPLPAALNLSFSHDITDRYAFELNYERTYWSSYKTLDFNYGSAIRTALVSAFDAPKIRAWQDTNTVRLGLTGKITDTMTLMAGIAKDDTPVQSEYIGYELPDSDATIYSLGLRVQATENLSFGIAYLHDAKDKRSIQQGTTESQINGTFSGGGADLLTVAVGYTF
jgi:long-chain fatty acid transport protein